MWFVDYIILVVTTTISKHFKTYFSGFRYCLLIYYGFALFQLLATSNASRHLLKLSQL